LPKLDDNPVPNIMSLGWNDLVLLKRKLSSSLRNTTQNIINIDTNKLPRINQQIYEEKTALNGLITKSKHNQMDIKAANAELLALSEKISQSKNFLGIMQNRLPRETEDSLLHVVKVNESLIHEGKYRSTREKDMILSIIGDATMKVEAIKAFRTIRAQLQQLESHSELTTNSLLMLNDESQSLQQEISRCKKRIQTSFDSKHQIVAERFGCLSEYNDMSLQLEKLNAQMDLAADQRRRQRQEQIRPVHDMNISKAKELARKKLQSGAKLSLEELRLLYDENDF
jgi:chromosome segregation ATPase